MMAISKQDIFIKKMLTDYKEGKINTLTFAPYFNWKLGITNGLQCTRKDAYNMMDKASELLEELCQKHPDAYSNLDSQINNDPLQNFRGYGEDCYLASYYAYIEDEVTNLILANYIKD